MSTADFTHIPTEFQPTDGPHTSASQGRDAKAGDSDGTAFCNAITAYICRYRDMDTEHRERVLEMLELQAARIGFADIRQFVAEQIDERDSLGGMMQQAM